MNDFSEPEDVFEQKLKKLWELLCDSKSTTVFTGAGVSTLSGIPDFRGQHGVYSDPWHGMNVEDIVSLPFFRKNPKIFYSWAKDVWYRLENYEPNVVHRVIAELEEKKFIKGIYTQNIDMLHQRAGSQHVYEIHGSPAIHHCTKCGKEYLYEEIAPIVVRGEVPKCQVCGSVIKPDIILYGESLNETILQKAWDEFSNCDLCLVLGSSLTVQPAAILPLLVRRNGGQTVIVNAQPTNQDYDAVLHFDDLKQVFTALEKKIYEKKK